jgi:hypothetical protein
VMYQAISSNGLANLRTLLEHNAHALLLTRGGLVGIG